MGKSKGALRASLQSAVSLHWHQYGALGRTCFIQVMRLARLPCPGLHSPLPIKANLTNHSGPCSQLSLGLSSSDRLASGLWGTGT